MSAIKSRGTQYGCAFLSSPRRIRHLKPKIPPDRKVHEEVARALYIVWSGYNKRQNATARAFRLVLRRRLRIDMPNDRFADINKSLGLKDAWGITG